MRRLVASKLEILSVLLTDQWFDMYEPLIGERDIEDGIYIGERKLLEEIVGYRLHQGIMAIGRVPEAADVFKTGRPANGTRLLVALDGIANSENMGVIVRNCAAFGVDALIVGETSCDPYLRRSVRNSMGTVFTLPIMHTENLASVLARLRADGGFRTAAAHPQEGSKVVTDVNMTGDTCIVMGSEGEGISPGVLSACSVRLSIPMQRDVDSINVATSAGVILYECWRQRAGLLR